MTLCDRKGKKGKPSLLPKYLNAFRYQNIGLFIDYKILDIKLELASHKLRHILPNT